MGTDPSTKHEILTRTAGKITREEKHNEVEVLGQGVNWRKVAGWTTVLMGIVLVLIFIITYVPISFLKNPATAIPKLLGKDFLIMFIGGFLAQMVDGALGMGYGLTSMTVLLSAGIEPAVISGSIHTAELFASGASGYSHYRFGNVNKKLFKILVVPGVLGAVLGAVLITHLGREQAEIIKPILAIYTLVLGVKILWQAFKEVKNKKFKRYGWLAGAGGFLDSFSGGGWGPIVTTTLVTKTKTPKYVIGTVSLTEFFVTLSSTLTFFFLLGISHWQTILGLIAGGVAAAPVAARLAGKMHRRTSFICLGVLVIIWSLKMIVSIL